MLMSQNKDTTPNENQQIIKNGGNIEESKEMNEENKEEQIEDEKMDDDQIYNLFMENMIDIENNGLLKEDQNKTPKEEIYNLYVDGMNMEYKKVYYYFNYTDWYIGYLLRLYRMGDNEVGKEIPIIIQYGIQRISEVFPEESIMHLLMEWIDIETKVFHNYEEGIKIIEQLVSIAGFSLVNWIKYVEVLKEKFDNEIEECKEEEKRNELKVNKIEKIRKVMNRMIHVMKGADKDTALEACTYAISFEQVYGNTKTLSNVIKKRDEIIIGKEKKEQKLKKMELKEKRKNKGNDKKPFKNHKEDKTEKENQDKQHTQYMQQYSHKGFENRRGNPKKPRGRLGFFQMSK